MGAKDIPWTSREGKLDAVAPGKDVWDLDAVGGCSAMLPQAALGARADRIGVAPARSEETV